MDGKRCANSMDYKGAIEQFEKALEANPRNAAAHFELGVLYDQREPDPAAAIYHYQCYTNLNPKGAQAELATTHILACKQQLARQVSLGPVTQTLEAEFQKLNEQNKRLIEENKGLREEVEKWKALASRPLAMPTNQPAVVPAPVPPASDPVVAEPVRSTTVNRASPTASVATPTSTSPTRPTLSARARRTHVVKHGETFGTIARQYGIRVDALMAANPRIEPRRLRAGQTLNLP